MMRWWWALIRFGFRLLYNELAFTYDWVSKIVSLGAWRCWQRTSLKHLNAVPNALILELAHGTGDLQIDLKQAGYLTVGYDLSPNMGRLAQAKLLKHGLSADLIRGKAQQLPFSTGVFAAVVSTFPADFIFASATLQEIHRVLIPGGRLVIVPNGMLTGGGLIKRLIEWLYQITGQRGESLFDEITAFFEAHHFEAIFVTESCPRSTAQIIIARKKV